MTIQKYKQVATIIANPVKFKLTKSEINSIISALEANGAIIENIAWLAENEACDIFFAVLSVEEVTNLLEQMTQALYKDGIEFDFVVQPTQGRKKKLLICDMDSTIIEQECIDELADFAGIKDKISAITERAMNGELDFKDALRERVKMLKGLSENVLLQAYEKHITVTSGAKKMVRTMSANGAKTVLISGGFTFFTSRIKDKVGFDIQEANILKIENGHLTGEVKEPILDSVAKLNALKFYSEEMDIGAYDVVAVGDGANDLPMIKNSGLGVAYYAKPNVRSQAKVKINSCDLTAILYAQGYKKNEFVN